jgi:NADPH:quinone reductase-like Zn-dependent oxidoreductase
MMIKDGKLVHVPTTLDPAEAVVLILNYLVAYQVLYRSAQAKPDDKVLIIGASGGVRNCFSATWQAGQSQKVWVNLPSKHNVLTEHRATPIDYYTQDFVEVIRQAEPNGLDFVFNGMGGFSTLKCYFGPPLCGLKCSARTNKSFFCFPSEISTR